MKRTSILILLSFCVSFSVLAQEPILLLSHSGYWDDWGTVTSNYTLDLTDQFTTIRCISSDENRHYQFNLHANSYSFTYQDDVPEEFVEPARTVGGYLICDSIGQLWFSHPLNYSGLNLIQHAEIDSIRKIFSFPYGVSVVLANSETENSIAVWRFDETSISRLENLPESAWEPEFLNQPFQNNPGSWWTLEDFSGIVVPYFNGTNPVMQYDTLATPDSSVEVLLEKEYGNRNTILSFTQQNSTQYALEYFNHETEQYESYFEFESLSIPQHDYQAERYSVSSFPLSNLYWVSTDSAGSNLNWQDSDGGIHVVQRAHHIIRFYSTLTEYSHVWYPFHSESLWLHWTEYNSETDSTYLYAMGVDGDILDAPELEKPIPESFSISQPWPNPFNSIVRFLVAAPRSGEFNINIYNSIGQLVDTIQMNSLSGSNSVYWKPSSNFAAGIYFIGMDQPGVNLLKVVYLK